MTVEIKVPQLGESVSEATVARWMKKVGEAVSMDEAIVELETEKVTMEVTAPSSGVLQAIASEQGATVGVGDLLGKIDPKGAASAPQAAAPAASPASSQASAPAAPKIAVQNIQGPALAPSAQKLAAERGIDGSQISGSGKDGRVTKGDVLNYTPASSAPRAKMEERVKMTRLRAKIAQRLKDAQNTAAILTTFNEIDMSAVINLRNQMKDVFEKKHGIKLGFMSFFLKAAVAALKEYPAVNAEIDGQDIVYKNYYDISVAVSSPQGLVVPVVRGVDQMSFAEIEGAILDLGKKAKDGKLTMEDMMGGTFTVSNGGVFGSLMSTPIINPPQSGILGMHKTQNRPVAVGDKIEIRPMMYVALSYDHRIIDGREAVSFLVRIKECIEDPQRMLLDI